MPDEKPDVPASGEITPDEVALHDLVLTGPAPAPASDATIDAPGSDTPVAPLAVSAAETGYTTEGVPTFDYAREKIDTRYGAAIGAGELAAETPEGRTIEEQYEARQKAAAERLSQIRESMRDDAPDT